VLNNGLERSPTVMVDQMFNVFEKNDARLALLDKLKNVIDERSARVFKPLHFAGYTKRLARETGAQNIVLRNDIQIEFGDVAKGYFAKVFLIRPLRMGVEF